MAAASAGETANATLSTSSAPRTKPMWRTRLAIGSDRVGCVCTSHRVAGTCAMASRPHAAMKNALQRDDAPSGSRALSPSIATLVPAESEAIGMDATAALAGSFGWSTDAS